jgi:hypothetical protein
MFFLFNNPCLSHSLWSCTLLGFVFACFCCGSLGALLPGTKVTLADARIVDGVAMLGDAAHVVRVCGRVEEMARAHQMKAEAASLRHRMFRAALADDEEPPPPFTLLEVPNWEEIFLSMFLSAAFFVCLQNHAF